MADMQHARALIGNTMSRAQQTICLLATQGHGFASTFREQSEEASKRGIRLRALLHQPSQTSRTLDPSYDPTAEAAMILRAAGWDVRMASEAPSTTCLITDGEAIMEVPSGHPITPTALSHVEDWSLVRMLRHRFELEWKDSFEVLFSDVAVSHGSARTAASTTLSAEAWSSLTHKPEAAFLQQPISPVRVDVIPVGEVLGAKLRDDPALIHQLSPDQFEEFVCDRLFAMGLEPQRVGRYNQRDGGIDVLFWPRACGSFPFLGAAQVKHRKPARTLGPAIVREFAAVVASQPINAGIIVTNTTFTPDAQWFARERAKLLRLRDFEDIRRWVRDDFTSDCEWREIPATIELGPGLVIKIR